MVGIRDKALSERLQLEADLTLEKAVNLVCLKEVVQKQQSLITRLVFTGPNIGVLKDAKHTRQRPDQQKSLEEKTNMSNSEGTDFLKSLR